MMRSVLKNILCAAFYILLESYELVEHNDVMIIGNYALYNIKNA
jgi:hypothetical protein